MSVEIVERRLVWKSCECGCKGSDIEIGPLYYWRYGKSVNTEHKGFSDTALGDFDSYAEVDLAVREDAKTKIEKLQAQIDEAKKILKP